MKSDQIRKVVTDAQKALDKARRALAALQKTRDEALTDTIPKLEAAISACKGLNVESQVGVLEEWRTALQAKLDALLGNRREQLIHAAKSGGWDINRLQSEDRIGCFKLKYKKAEIQISLGSEPLTKFTEPDGIRVFEKLKEIRDQLERFPFDRETFFSSIKDALRLAELKGIRSDSDGHVLVRDLFPMVVIARALRDPTFQKRPVIGSVKDYPLAQFMFDFSRFGEGGWSMPNGQRLSAPTPNSEQVARGNTIALPQLGHDGRTLQVGRLGVKR